MSNIIHIAFYSCKTASELIDLRYEKPLSISENFRLRIHLSMCNQCLQYSKQSKIIDDAIQKMLRNELENTSRILDSEMVKSLLDKVSEAGKK